MVRANYLALVGSDCNRLKFVSYWNSWGEGPVGH